MKAVLILGTSILAAIFASLSSQGSFAATETQSCSASAVFGDETCSKHIDDCEAGYEPYCDWGWKTPSCDCVEKNSVGSGPVPRDTDIPTFSSSDLSFTSDAADYLYTKGTSTADDVAGDLDDIVTAVNGNDRAGYNSAEANFCWHLQQMPSAESDDFMGWVEQNRPLTRRAALFEGSERTLSLSIHPSQLFSNARVRVSTPENSYVLVAIYNSVGSLVTTLHSGMLDDGQYTWHWDGTNASGHVVSNGLYFVQVTAGDQIATSKVVLQR